MHSVSRACSISDCTRRCWRTSTAILCVPDCALGRVSTCTEAPAITRGVQGRPWLERTRIQRFLRCLKRFDPTTLEKRLKSHSVIESILPAARKAKYWELYEELYKEIAREAEDDFQGLFGREFATAYERQVKKL